MRILFIGDYSNLHTTIAKELRNLGHTADVVSDGCGHMQLRSEIFLKREKGFLGGFKYLYDIFSILPRLSDYDVVQLINTNFLKLRPAKIKYFFDRLKEQNKSVFLTLAGNDYFYCKACFDEKLFRYSEFKIGHEFTPGFKQKPQHLYGWISNDNKRLAEYIVENITGGVSVLPEYDMVYRPLLGDKLAFTNLPIDFSQLPAPQNFVNDKVNLFVAMRSGVEHWKGTGTLLKIAKEIEKDMPGQVEVEIARDLSFTEFLSRMSKSDIVLDQLYAYSPAMTALYAMSMAKVAATGAQPEYYQAIGNPDKKPIFSLAPTDNDIKERLADLITNRDKIIKHGKESQRIVSQHNDSRIVTEKFLRHWNNLI